MSNLFVDIPDFRTSTPENSGELRKTSGLLPESLKGKGNSGSAGLPLPSPPEKSGRSSFPQAKGFGQAGPETLREKRNSLLLQVEEANRLIDGIVPDNERLKRHFYQTSDVLLKLHASRNDGVSINKTKMLAAYDRRVEAGHAWNPVRAKLREAERWKKEVLAEVAEINKQMEKV